MVLLLSGSGSFKELIVILLIFVLVLGATALTTKWVAEFQKQQGAYGNIELIEAARLGNNKYIQIVRIGQTYMALAVCKDTVTMLGEIPSDQIENTTMGQKVDFKHLLEKTLKKETSQSHEPKE